jgi:stearoyl-CoA desaturase (delta-9 desaturase)
MISFKNLSKAFWLQFVPGMALGSTTILLLILGAIPVHYLWATFVMWILVCGLGIAVGYHRVFSHRTYKLPVWKENIILFFATFAGQGASIFWAAMHRGYHHPHADTAKDLHSPVAYDKTTAFVGWYLKLTTGNNPVNIKYAVDLLKKKNHVWLHNHYHSVLWGVPCIVAVFDWRLALTAFCLVTFIGLLQDNLVNVYGHLKGGIGYRNFETSDNSHNNPVLGYLAWGQGWHNNHHHSPGSFDFGKGVSGKWWEWDPSRIFRPFLGNANQNAK